MYTQKYKNLFISPQLTKLVYIDYDCASSSKRLYIKNIDYTSQYAYNIRLPNDFSYLTYQMTSYGYK